ncbi:flagellar hook-associated protein 3 [Shewanella sp. Choline-02u-19]|jgi:flagellar hook-associated protein 3 FlgL|uniref:flagellar hook-associated protein FlgL n=1 Tax=unclassified Shewanella TaxID=196818 RepID=UPI000C34E44B|nr:MULTISPECIES: flagellar hook-associated protein FlgL [unclassified Shewanella]PKG56101.1 flagellar hook-associated protein 3 [Shewanella sp. GutDb-MelDb]PKH57273.1 flagellar hook-associated protein 3 [Shewanella sp. Bg11-22]PKI29613.1 flagellar hook-associated protein 3 [Shewanella sp. Choline-02u-19]
MRVSMLNLYSNNLQSLQKSTVDISKLNQMMASGKSILRPSDDPIGSVKVINSQRDMAATNQYIKNTESLSTSFGRAETYMSSMVELQSRMREITVAANNGSLSPEDRAAYAAEMDELLEAFVDTVNAKDEGGNYLFSGNLTDTAPIGKDASGNYVYQGDTNHREVQTSGSSWMTANSTAAEFIFANGSADILNQTKDFITVLEDPTLAPGDPTFSQSASDMLTSLDDTLTSISSAITDIGGKQNTLSLIQTSHEERVLFNEEVIGETEGLDYAQATAEFNLKLTTLQVTQKTFVQVSQLSLFNHI